MGGLPCPAMLMAGRGGRYIGAWTPPEAMAPWMRFIMYVSPLHYYIDSCLGTLLKGAGTFDGIFFTGRLAVLLA